MKHRVTAFLALIFFICVEGEASPMMINGGFETGDLNGWQTIGDVSVQTGTIGSGPTQGDYQAMLTNDATAYNNPLSSGDRYVYPFSDRPAVLIDDAFFGLAAGTLDTITVSASEDPLLDAPVGIGSGMKQSFSAQQGERLIFDWNYVTNDALNYDFAFVSLVSADLILTAKLAGNIAGGPNQPGIVLPFLSETPFSRETGFSTFSFVLPRSGDYTFGVAVFQVEDDAFDSGLLIDGVRVTRIPEPSTILLFGTGLAGIALCRRKNT